MVAAVISDTHLPRGARRLPAACVDRLRRAELVLHAGDLSSRAFLQELEALGPPVLAVHGNADERALKEALPAQLVVELGAFRIGMTHNAGPRAARAERLLARFPGCDAVVYGHSHVPEAVKHEGVWILNPGSPTDRRRQPSFTMAELRASRAGLAAKVVVLRP